MGKHSAGSVASDAPADRAADRLLLRVSRRAGGWLCVLALAGLTEAGAQSLLPAAIGRAVDAGLHTASRPGPWPASVWVGGCAALLVLSIGCQACVQLLTGTITARSTAWLRGLVSGHVLAAGPGPPGSFPSGSFPSGSFPSGDTVSRITAGAADAGGAPASGVLAITAVVLPAASIVALGLIDPWLAAAFCAGLPVLALAVRSFSRGISDITVRYQRAQGAIAARLLDALGGARTIAAAGTWRLEARRVLTPLAELRRYGEDSWRVQGRIIAQGSLLVPLLQVVVVAVAGTELARRRISPGELLAAAQYAVLGAGIGTAIGQVGRLARARAGARRCAGPLAVPVPGYGSARLPPGTGCLRLRNVSAHSGGDAVLRGLDFTVPGGALVAVVGSSGAGKSLLASLAGRLADPGAGEVLLDGVPLPRLTHAELRRAVVHAFERPALFGVTVGEAIAFGPQRSSEAQVATAARAACAEEFISRLPAGMDTPADEAPLSGGELQRLGLARAFAHAGGARLLILDDATSSLDTVTEMQVSRSLAGEFGHLTRLIVAHRATTAARADLVVWLADGTLRALAPHHELWADAEYRALFGHGPFPSPRAHGDGNGLVRNGAGG